MECVTIVNIFSIAIVAACVYILYINLTGKNTPERFFQSDGERVAAVAEWLRRVKLPNASYINFRKEFGDSSSIAEFNRVKNEVYP
jgi:hypothetical protein